MAGLLFLCGAFYAKQDALAQDVLTSKATVEMQAERIRDLESQNQALRGELNVERSARGDLARRVERLER